MFSLPLVFWTCQGSVFRWIVFSSGGTQWIPSLTNLCLSILGSFSELFPFVASPTCSLCSVCSFVCDGSFSFLISCFPSPCHRFCFLDGFFSSMLQFPVEHFIPTFRCAVSKNSLYSLKVQGPFALLSQLHKHKARAVFLQNPRVTSAASSLLPSPSAVSGSLLVSASPVVSGDHWLSTCTSKQF